MHICSNFIKISFYFLCIMHRMQLQVPSKRERRLIVSKHRVRKCESCNEEMKHAQGCMNCEEESILKAKVKKVMGEFKKGELHSGRGGDVTSHKQAIAIALNLGRQAIKKSGK